MNFWETTIINTFIFTFPILIYLFLCKNFEYETINPYGKWLNLFTSLSFIILSIIFIAANIWFLLHFRSDYHWTLLTVHILLIVGMVIGLFGIAAKQYSVEQRLRYPDKFIDSNRLARADNLTAMSEGDTIRKIYPDKIYEKSNEQTNLENMEYQYRRNKRLDDIDERDPYELRKLTKKYNI